MAIPTDLKELTRVLERRSLPRTRSWQGAGVFIALPIPPMQKERGDVRTDPVFVVTTPHACEVSWFFCVLGDSFGKDRRLDGCSKIKFFWRLAWVACRLIAAEGPEIPARFLCAGVLREAFRIYGEMEEGSFGRSNRVGEEVSDNGGAKPSHAPCPEDTRSFFQELGIDIDRKD